MQATHSTDREYFMLKSFRLIFVADDFIVYVLYRPTSNSNHLLFVAHANNETYLTT